MEYIIGLLTRCIILLETTPHSLVGTSYPPKVCSHNFFGPHTRFLIICTHDWCVRLHTRYFPLSIRFVIVCPHMFFCLYTGTLTQTIVGPDGTREERDCSDDVNSLFETWFNRRWSLDVRSFLGDGFQLLAADSTWESDMTGRPVCPGPLRDNHGLWWYDQTTSPWKMMVDSDGEPSQACFRGS